LCYTAQIATNHNDVKVKAYVAKVKDKLEGRTDPSVIIPGSAPVHFAEYPRKLRATVRLNLAGNERNAACAAPRLKFSL
jgi:hypothetical protein